MSNVLDLQSAITNQSADAAGKIAKYVECIYEPTDIVEIRHFSSGPDVRSFWVLANELANEASSLQSENQFNRRNVYIGVNPRIAENRRGDASIALARSVFADFDHTTPEQAVGKIAAVGLPQPTLLVNSGNGTHAYWRLLESVSDMKHWTGLQKALAEKVGSDPAVSNPERIMRVPGFLNLKSEPGKPCIIVEADPRRRFLLNELALDCVEAEPAAKQAGPIGETIVEGERNSSLFSLAGSMQRRGMTSDAILSALKIENQKKCRPPLLDAEVETIVANISQYKPAPVSALVGDYVPFPLHVLPPVVRRYVEECAYALGCDPAFIAAPILPVLAAAIGNTARIQLKRDWVEPCILWAVIVAPSGTMKSPAFCKATQFVWDRQRELWEAYRHTRKMYDQEFREWKRSKSSDEAPAEPKPCEHPLVNDITIEAVADRLAATAKGTLVAIEELAAWLGSFNAYKRGGSDMQHWLTLHGGQALKIDRKTGDKTTLYVSHASASVVGTTQPGTLRKSLTPELFDSGLAARLLMVMPPTRPKVWTDRRVESQTENDIRALFKRLYDYPADKTGPLLIGMTDEATEEWAKHVNSFNAQLIQRESEREKAAWAKLEGAAARFALIFHIVRLMRGEKEGTRVDLDDVKNGIVLANWFANEAVRVLAAIVPDGSGRSKDNKDDERNLLDWINANGGKTTVRELQRNRPRQYPSAEDAEAELKRLVSNGLLISILSKPGTSGGRPVEEFRIKSPETTVAEAAVDTTPKNQLENRGSVNCQQTSQERKWRNL